MGDLAEEFKASIQAFYDALMSKDPDGVLSLCTEDAVLGWGPYSFEGKEEIKRWATELGLHFAWFRLENVSVAQEKDSVVHRFNIRVTMPNGQRGWLPVEGKYEFEKGRFRRIWINPSRGYILIKRRDFS